MTTKTGTPEAEQTCVNTDRELWRETPDDYYAPSIHVTAQGGIGINVGGSVYVKPLREWHKLAGGAINMKETSLQRAARDYAVEAVGGSGSPRRHEQAFQAGAKWALKRVRAELVEWLDVTGVIPKGTSYYHECLACVDDVVSGDTSS